MVDETERIAEEIAQETVQIISDRFRKMENKIERLETDFKRIENDSLNFMIEFRRMFSEESQKLWEELNQVNLGLTGELRKLREEIGRIKEKFGIAEE